MNLVELTGRAARDPEFKKSSNGVATAWLTLAVDKQRQVKENESSANFIRVVCFGKTAELVQKYVKKGRMVGVTGRIDTGYYEKQGQRVYTTDILVNRLEFLSKNVSDDKPISMSATESKEETAAIAEAAIEEAVENEEAAANEETAAKEAAEPAVFEDVSADDTPF